MKKRNGFTLVELLGVIVILAILSLITIPIISNVINDIRIKALKNSAYGLIEASQLYYAQYGSSNIRFDINNNKVSSSDTDNLISYKGSIKTGTVILDKKGSVTVCITDGKNSAYKNYNETKVTAVKGKCEIGEGSSIVYLDGEATIDELSLAELTEKVLNLENSTLKIDDIYPIGSVYTSFEDDTVAKVQARFGGTWEQLESGRMLQSTSTNSNQKSGSTTASFTPTGTVGDWTLSIDQIPAHTHTRGTMNITGSISIPYATGLVNGNGYHGPFNYGTGALSSGAIAGGYDYSLSVNAGTMNQSIAYFEAYRNWTGETSSVGGSQSHTHSFTGNQTTINTVPPYITVYMYKRTA